MGRDFDHETGFIQPCVQCELTEAYRGQWKSTSLRFMDTNLQLEKDIAKWKELAWLGYKVIHDGWEPTQFEQAYEELINERSK